MATEIAALGFCDLRLAADLDEAAVALAERLPAILLCSGDGQPEGIALARALRRGRLGATPLADAAPFCILIAVLDHPHEDAVAACIDAGVDAIAAAPLTRAGLTACLAKSLRQRRPFVVTRDYVGPDRRTAPRQDSATPFVVPNPLLAAQSGLAPTAWAAECAAARAALDRRAAAAAAQALEWIFDHRAQELAAGQRPAPLDPRTLEALPTWREYITRRSLPPGNTAALGALLAATKDTRALCGGDLLRNRAAARAAGALAEAFA